MTVEDEDEAAAHWEKVVGEADMSTLRKKTRAGSALDVRREREQAEAGPSPDGRSLRTTGRTEQLNVKVRPDTKKKLERIAKLKGSSHTGVIEWLIDKCWSELEDERNAGTGA